MVGWIAEMEELRAAICGALERSMSKKYAQRDMKTYATMEPPHSGLDASHESCVETGSEESTRGWSERAKPCPTS